jgi:hypothetical protein
MRLNLGCGHKAMKGWINVDKIPVATADQVVDLEALPWPWPENAAEEVLLHHVLEHLGAATALYLGIIKELYRVCRDGAKITVVVPHPRHDHFLRDPTHVRPITPEGLRLFSQAFNRQTMAEGMAQTPLGIYTGVDFTIDSVRFTLDEHWRGRFERKEISPTDLNDAIRSCNNVVSSVEIIMRPIKPAGRALSSQIP